MLLKFLDILVLLGALHGFIMCGLLFFTRANRRANRILAIIILFIATACLNLYLESQPWFFNNATLQFAHAFIPLVVVMPIGPLIYFYVKSLFEPDFAITRNQSRYFFPTIIDLIPQLTAVVYLSGVLVRLIKPDNASWGSFIDTYNVYADVPRWMSLVIYLLLTTRNIRQHTAVNRTQPLVRFAWAKQFVGGLMIFSGIWLLHLVPYVIPRFSDRLLDLVSWYPVYIPMTILLYWLSIKGYFLQNQPITDLVKIGRQPTLSLSAEVIRRANELLNKAMVEDQLYLDPNLNLNQLSRETGLAPKTISAFLNQHLHKSFSEFVNSYRVEEIKTKILEPVNNHLTISGIAYDCGFNSQPTFHRAFKAATGLTPKAFLQQHGQKVKQD